MYLIVAVIIILFIIYVSKYDIDDKQEIEVDEILEDDTQSKKPKEIIFKFNTDVVRFSLYSPHIFTNYRAIKLYKKVVINRLFIDEPFHTAFMQLLQIYDHTQSWLKSNKTKEIKLKIRNKNANFEEGISFKVHAVSEIAFDFLGNILEYFNENRYSKEDQKNILLVALVWKLDCVKELKHLCIENLDDIELREYLAKKILKYHGINHDVFQILRMLEKKHENVQFIFRMYDKALEWQQEYPYVCKGEEEYEKFNIDNLADKGMKQLMGVDNFSVY